MYHWSSKKKRGKRESEAETTSEESLVKMDEKQDQATNSSDITNPRQDKQNENITLKNENNKAYR